MRLYATVSSERATKGQGGNNLEIKVYGESRTEPLFTITANRHGQDTLLEVIEWHLKETKTTQFWARGSKCVVCNRSDVFMSENEKGEWVCDTDWGKEKGEKQKGECSKCNRTDISLYNLNGKMRCDDCLDL